MKELPKNFFQTINPRNQDNLKDETIKPLLITKGYESISSGKKCKACSPNSKRKFSNEETSDFLT